MRDSAGQVKCWKRRAGGTVVAAWMLLTLLGCARTVVPVPLETNYDASDPSNDLEFLSRLADRTAVSNDEGLHALIMFAVVTDPCGSYVERVAFMKERGWLPESWNEASSLAMQRGAIAPAIADLCKVKGGVIMQALGPNQRYASRELAYLGILTPGSEQQTMTGREFMSILGKVQDYMLVEEALADKEAEKKQAAEGQAGAGSK
ncbi:MAG: hypothetical protein H7210_12480 [Pyrinomonadaceae bacterium]|nr:hypothetical protein [Phycisphaerales bacterium]